MQNNLFRVTACTSALELRTSACCLSANCSRIKERI